jgi:voltage-gated potassium channel
MWLWGRLSPESSEHGDAVGKEEALQQGKVKLTYTRSAIYDAFILVVTVLSLVVVLALLFLPLSQVTQEALARIDTLLAVVFMLDAFFHLATVPDKRSYMKWGWLDFVGSVPGYPIMRFARLSRAVQAARDLRGRGGSQVAREFRESRPRTTYFFTFFIAILVVSIASLFMVELENRAPNANISSGRDAFWWAFVTITTVGYGDHVPVTWPGQLIAIALMVVGVGIFGVFTSSVASWFLHTGEARTRQDIADIKRDVDAMMDELAGMKRDVADLKELLKERDR